MFRPLRESSLLAATVLYPLAVRCDMVIFPVYVRKIEIAGNYDIMCVYLVS